MARQAGLLQHMASMLAATSPSAALVLPPATAALGRLLAPMQPVAAAAGVPARLQGTGAVAVGALPFAAVQHAFIHASTWRGAVGLLSRSLSTIPHTDSRTNQSSRKVPPINPRHPDADQPQEVSDGRSSETNSVRATVDDDTMQLVSEVFTIYEAADPQEQQRILEYWYAEDCVYEDNFMKLEGRKALEHAFANMLRLVEDAEVKYETPVVVGATGRIDGVVGDYRDKPGLQVEVQNTQKFKLLGTGSLPAQLVSLPREVVLEGVTSLTLDASGKKVVRHEDRWHNLSHHTELFRRAVGLLVGNVGGLGARTGAVI